jgi:uncharacterized repeat protein (TIGR01451 family)
MTGSIRPSSGGSPSFRGVAGRAWQRFAVAVTLLVSLAAFALSPVRAQQIGPTVSVDPTSGPAGTPLLISGTGFVGDQLLFLSLGAAGADDVDLGSVAVNADGAFETDDVSIPAGTEPGHYAVSAQGCAFVVNGDACVPSNNFAETPFEVTPGRASRYVPQKPMYTSPMPDHFSETEAHLKFVQGSMVRLTNDHLLPFVFDSSYAPTPAQQEELADINALLAGVPGLHVSRLFANRSVAEYDRERARQERASGKEIGDKNLYYLLTYPDDTDVAGLLNALNAFDIVEIAYADTRVLDFEDLEPTNHSPDHRWRQGYREAAPGGINADAAYFVAGGRGQNVQAIDIERFFNAGHEDLPVVSVFPNGDPDAEWPGDAFDHGTAVMGQLFAQDNGFGVLGIIDLGAPGFVSTAGGRPQAIDLAHSNSNAGDVVLLELQRAGPNGGCASQNNQTGCAPEEWLQASYDAVVAAVADGIIIVAAAGNGFQDLDSDPYQEWRDRGDSGAIIVGAGAAPGCTNPARSRRDFSNFGARVNLQGWGECVATTGYGTLAGNTGLNDRYTGGFGGTSSASPIVAGAAGVVSSVRQQQGLGTPTSQFVRTLLRNTGTPQVLPAEDPAALAGNIGPLPNLAAALGVQADLAVTKTADPDPVAAGTNITYTVSVTNQGPNVAVHVELVDTLPSQVNYLSDNQADCTHSAGVVTCDVGTLQLNETFTVEIVARVPSNAVYLNGGPFTITNTATATSSLTDPDAGNSTATAETLVVAVADLEVRSVEVANVVPPQQLVGVGIPVTVRSVVRNNGPSTPIDAVVDTDGTPSAGAAVDPASRSTTVAALATVMDREVIHEFSIQCTAPGTQQVVFDVEIRPQDPQDTDPDPSNNTGQVTVEVECILPIVINIRPGNQFNQINLGSNQVVPVAALTTAAGEYGLPLAFDATLIVPGSVRFGAANVVWGGSGGAPFHNGIYHIQDSFELDDRTKDGDLDMWGNFRIPDTGIQAGDTEACMSGQYVSGGMTFSFFGCDFIAIQ